ncbi:alkyl hydroperoxide reductase/ Thiol specific antioxidant/ Mal allergen [Oleidesulfovibrio alaskensis G20]|jgi:thiol-disulfide isomerase/thioredoxin|uniref:Alkyl hydroperoxide reductase/ Thiol specific antioxidant/ Mal allergen n=1 Tax=Oleidesulfovibrio alaskensis (strain ATCC BAA-1058 / DSM 17464 / G20) TaxID=207559 RepID=Q314Y2_OLEA2|nr:TlpA disulfide reductase family protein [Oleidesulfovibrio alaskensis]ABB37514.2 alkyl hydroperoxide reductase/ Thiol specific antioxidant/ Mal allergen [Oleidesulfovibrio alaskensis G20]MBG0773186.1 TlpA family protein disulfide reductase [Oleidesulfovibrio alaskensis]
MKMFAQAGMAAGGIRGVFFLHFARTGAVRCCVLAAVLCCMLAGAAGVRAAEPFPDITLPPHPQAAQLGLPGHSFRLSDTTADVLLVNVYSWFCGPCQAEAPRLAALDREIRRQGLKDRVLLIGIAAGDGPDMVERFREKHAIPFALFADPDMTLYAGLGGLPVPAMHVVRRTPQGLVRTELHLGMFAEEPAAFLRRVAALP